MAKKKIEIEAYDDLFEKMDRETANKMNGTHPPKKQTAKGTKKAATKKTTKK